MTKKISSFRNLKVAALLCAAKAAIPCGIAASKLEYRLKRILRMISTIRRINCFMDTCHSLRLFVLSQRIVSIHTAGVSSF